MAASECVSLNVPAVASMHEQMATASKVHVAMCLVPTAVQVPVQASRLE